MALLLDPSIAPFAATFFFVFALVFGLLTVSKLLDKNVNAILALAIAVFSVFYEPLVLGLQQFIPIAAIFLIILFFLVFLKKLFGDEKKQTDTLPMVVTMAVLLLALGVLVDKFAAFLPTGLDPAVFLWVGGLLFVVLIFYGVWSRKEGKET